MSGRGDGGDDGRAAPDRAVRRTQAERTAATRAALLDATIECLVELGFTETTTREVAVRAGVSRGAQAHHFPTKTDLVAAAIERMARWQVQRSVAAFRQLPPEDRTFEAVFDLLWAASLGAQYPAVAEVAVAGRTDDRLGGLVRDLSAELEDTVVGLVREVTPSLGNDAEIRTLVNVALAILHGAALARWSGYTEPGAAPRLFAVATTHHTAEGTALLSWLLRSLESPEPPT